MSVQTWRNLATNPRAVGVTGSYITDWEDGASAASGAGGGGPIPVTRQSLAGGPSAAIPSYAYMDLPGPAGTEFDDVTASIGTRVPLTPGATYTFSTYARVSVSGLPLSLRIWSEDAGGRWAEVGTITAPQPSIANIWKALSTTVTMPAGTVSTIIQARVGDQSGAPLPALRLSATGFMAVPEVDGTAYNGHYFDGGARTTDRNEFPNPNFLGPAAPVNANGFTTSIANIGGTRWGVGTATTAGDATLLATPTTRIPVTPGQSLLFKATFGTTADRHFRIGFRYYNSGGTLVATTAEPTLARLNATTGIEHVTDTVPPGAAFAAPYIFRPGTQAPAPAVGDVIRVTGVYVGANMDSPVFSGDTPSGSDIEYSWAGTPNDSASIKEIRALSARWLGVAHASASELTITLPDPPVVAMRTFAMPVPTPVPGVVPRTFKQIHLESFSVVEDSTPVDPSDTAGGVGQMTLTGGVNDDSLFLIDVPLDLIDPAQGTTRGTIRGLSTNNDTLTLTADSRLAQLAVMRQAAPFVGTLEQAFVYYLSLVGITGGLVVDDTIATRPVIFPGWFGDAWLQMKKMAVSVGAEVSLVSNNVVLRPVRQRLAENYRDSNRALALDTGNLAQAVEIYYYNHEYHESKIAYPSGGWSPEVKIYTLDAGETIEEDIQIDASLMSIDQPTCVDWVDRYHVASSVYSVAGAGSGSSLPIPPAQWTDSGGSLTVEIGEDTRSIRLKITASTDTQYAPYQIAMTAGPSDQYSSLRLVGRGVFFDRQLLTLHTNVNPDRVSQEVGATVDNEFINTLDDAFTVGAWAVSKWGVPRRTITVNSSGINRLGDTGNYRYPTIKDWNDLYAGQTIGQWNGVWAGQKVGAVNTLMRDMTANDFDNQAFGNIGGARVHLDDAYYRIRNATVTQDGIGYTAEADTTIRDLNVVWGGKTVAQWNEQWAESRLLDQALAPLRKD